MNPFKLLWQAARDFLDDDCLSSGAAIAFYTVFSLPPLLTIIFSLATATGFREEQVQDLIKQELGLPLGDKDDQQSAKAEDEDTSLVARTVGVVLLLISASGVFGQLQYSLNKAWEVKPSPTAGIWGFVVKRFLSIGLVLVIGFILLVSLVLTVFMEQLTRWVGVPSGEGQIVGIIINEVLAVGVATLLFAAIFYLLPDAKIQWRDVWVGAAVTALLFVIGKAVIGWYLATAHVGEDWGSSAVSVIGALVWVYYSSLIVLFGAELTQVWANRHGEGVVPVNGAVRTDAPQTAAAS